jgi:hypothetical protein
MEVTKEKFESYVNVQEEGLYNMLSQHAQEAAGLTKEEHLYIISNYGKLKEFYSE